MISPTVFCDSSYPHTPHKLLFVEEALVVMIPFVDTHLSVSAFEIVEVHRHKAIMHSRLMVCFIFFLRNIFPRFIVNSPLSLTFVSYRDSISYAGGTVKIGSQ